MPRANAQTETICCSLLDERRKTLCGVNVCLCVCLSPPARRVNERASERPNERPFFFFSSRSAFSLPIFDHRSVVHWSMFVVLGVCDGACFFLVHERDWTDTMIRYWHSAMFDQEKNGERKTKKFNFFYYVWTVVVVMTSNYFWG